MWQYGFTSWSYQSTEGGYFYEEEVPSEGLDMNLVEAWNSGSI